ncbi:hypothetical protein H6P81_005731 [Aristolochia fimbriata]|uniref:Receptor-like serine/threonine-protein kinase n=1 Tax=Aristolochia fimbriata TaxID=158543 RepID=A0AAV7EVE5_ARIFI|nr:hypothetical protein H6P81_005731 [Aristolochia fimbriata]
MDGILRFGASELSFFFSFSLPNDASPILFRIGGGTSTMAAVIAFFLFSVISLSSCEARDTITRDTGLKDGETLVSAGGKFELGFFTLGGRPSGYRYVEIRYTSDSGRPVPVIWVANKETPLADDSSGAISINENGSLVVTDGRDQNPLWSTPGSIALRNTSARLWDTGNLVLLDMDTEEIVWESFDHPDHAFVSQMKVGINVYTNQSRFLKSWKGPSDPSVGNFTLGISPLKPYQTVIWADSGIHWRSGPWNSRTFLGVPWMTSFYLNGFSFTTEGGSVDFRAEIFNESESNQTLFMLNSTGSLERLIWGVDSKAWVSNGGVPMSECDVYGKCGPSGVCNPLQSPLCTCLRGFEPRFEEEWSKGNWTGGCVRRNPLSCEANGSSAAEKKEHGFLRLQNVKPPDSIAWLSFDGAQGCEGLCLRNCSCAAYAFDDGIGCMFWREELMDLQQFPIDGVDLYLRLPVSELVPGGQKRAVPGGKKRVEVIVVTVVVLGTTTICVFVFLVWRWIARHGEPGESDEANQRGNHAVGSATNSLPINLKQEQGPELPIFDFIVVSHATDNFSPANMLGEGGFGPVYKGRLPGGQEIAVKKLSRSSGQGLQEFRNEVLVISKVQHKNLVRLLGYCVHGEEKMLVYEYMPNKSLDAFIFDEKKLDWPQRFHVIEGIARGLLYLHRDSRLKIIHRDLKASNILLDNDLNPKISDFGLARIFGGDQIQEKTKRVVGTYGYMSPEYAMEGRFSEKSDIFSFGVLLLEIVSGKKNTSFYNDEHSLNLLSLAWKLWNNGQALELIDSVLSSTYSEPEVKRCIHVGLLCVQEFAVDRPSTSAITLFLGTDTVISPIPKQPAFTVAKSRESPSSSDEGSSINNVTITTLDGR